MRRFRNHLVCFLAISLWGLSLRAQDAGAGREFIMSCTYGILSGTLVGAASLAFEENPGDKLHRVARGASIGLYAGILLGVYVVYVVPAQIEEMEQQELQEQTNPEAELYMDGTKRNFKHLNIGWKQRISIPRLQIQPTWNHKTWKPDGMLASYQFLRF